MSLFSRRPRGRMAVYACSLMVPLLSAQAAQASSSDEWAKFQQDVENACLAAANGALQVKNIQVDPYGSESYGFALLSGVENGSSRERLVACAYGKQSQVAEISGVFDGNGVAIEPAVDIPAPADLPRSERLTQNGHYLVFQEDGNLCVYREADDGWVWCINNDPSIRYAETATVRTTQAGQLIGQDASGVVLYALPREMPFTPVGLRLSTEGALEIYSAGGVLWSSAN